MKYLDCLRQSYQLENITTGSLNLSCKVPMQKKNNFSSITIELIRKAILYELNAAYFF